MDENFLLHNTHLEAPDQFWQLDPQLRRLKQQPFVYNPTLLDQLPIDTPGIYTIGGGRQIGKTTLLKQWMAKLLAMGIPPQTIAFFTGEMIDDHHSLLRLLRTQLLEMPIKIIKYLLVDEVTYIRDWDKAVKYAADAGLLEDVVMILTGSDLVLVQEARMRFPGRRGTADVINFHLYPLTFRETVLLKHKNKPVLNLSPASPEFNELLRIEFNNYLIHGGYLTAINNIAQYGKILDATLMIYSDWVRGDMLKRGRQEHYLREILTAIIKRYMSQLSWNALAKDLSIDHPKTVADYIALLESMDVVFTQSALLEDKLCAAPKKAKKVMFTDPFIYHAIRAWVFPQKDVYATQIQPLLNDPEQCAAMVEACVATHYRRYYPTFYIKAEGEVDVAYIHKECFWPIEIKWTQQLHVKDLKQITKYKNGKILTKNINSNEIQGIKAEFLPLSLWRLSEADLLNFV